MSACCNCCSLSEPLNLPQYLVAEVAAAELELRRDVVIQLDLDACDTCRPSVSFVVYVAEDVVAAKLLLRLHDAEREVVLSRKTLPPVSAASVASVSCESLMPARCELYAEPLKMPVPRDAPLLAPPPGGSAIRPRASIGIDRHVRLHRRIDRGFQLRLVIHAGLADAAGDVHQRFLLRQRRQLFRGALRWPPVCGPC